MCFLCPKTACLTKVTQISLMFSFESDKKFRSVPLSIYYFSDPIHPLCLLCENGSGPVKFSPLSSRSEALSVKDTKETLQEERDFTS